MKNSTELWNNGNAYVFSNLNLFINKSFFIWLMRISFIITFAILMSFQMLLAREARGQTMSEAMISMKLENETLLDAIKEMEAKTSFRFFFRRAELKDIAGISLPLNTRSVETTLKEILRNTDITFKQVENNILLERRNNQEGYLIKGRILGPDYRPAKLTTIQVMKTPGNEVIITALADTGGRFSLRLVNKGEYMLKISASQTDTLIQRVRLENDNTIDLPDLILSRNTIHLNDVSIVSNKPLINRSIDKLTLNIQGTVYEKGENALKLFGVIPGVVMNGRNILFRGSEGVTVYVDNRRILFQGEQLLSYLRAIPSESIKSYELKAVPGAEIDAQNAGVVINIVLKAEYKYGLTCNIGTGYWNNDQDNTKATTFLNYRAGKFNFQGGFNYFWTPSFYQDEITQKFKGTNVYSLQNENYLERYHNISYNAGLEFKASEKQTLGANYNMFTNPGSVSSIYTTDIAYFNDIQPALADSSSRSVKSTIFTYANHMANVYYRNKIDTLGSRLDIGYSYIYYGLTDPASLETSYTDRMGSILRANDGLFTKTTGRSNVHVGNVDLEKYFTSTTVLNLGAKFTASSTDYKMDFRKGLTEQSILDPLRSNSFVYHEYISAIYSSLSGSINKWEYKLGLRAEQTNYNGQSITTQQTIGRNQLNLFPAVFFNRKFGNNHSYTLSYNRRIERPGFRQLNPFITYTNLNSVQEGNPELQPYFSNNLQLEYLFKNKYSITIGYQNTNNGITENITNRGETVVSRDENISDNNNVFASLYIPVKLTSWWDFNTNATFRNKTLDVRGTVGVKRSKFTQNVWATSKFNLPGKYFIEVSGFFNSDDFYGIYDSHSRGKIDVTVKKSFFKDKLTSSLEFQDPFKLYRPKSVINTPDFTRTIVRKRLDFVRYVGIFLTYNFSIGKKQNNKEDVDAPGNQLRGRL